MKKNSLSCSLNVPIRMAKECGSKEKTFCWHCGRSILQSHGRAGSPQPQDLDHQRCWGLSPFSQSQHSATWLQSQIILNFIGCWVVSICVSEPETRTWPIVDGLSERLITFPSQLQGSIWTIDNNLGARSCETRHESWAEGGCVKHSSIVIKDWFSY